MGGGGGVRLLGGGHNTSSWPAWAFVCTFKFCCVERLLGVSNSPPPTHWLSIHHNCVTNAINSDQSQYAINVKYSVRREDHFKVFSGVCHLTIIAPSCYQRQSRTMTGVTRALGCAPVDSDNSVFRAFTDAHTDPKNHSKKKGSHMHGWRDGTMRRGRSEQGTARLYLTTKSIPAEP